MSIWQDVHARYRSATVTVAVAGLSRAGKTALITSLIANLEASSRNPAARTWLQSFDVVDGGRLRSAEQPPSFRPVHGRPFPYNAMLAKLTADEPGWPERTANIYERAIDIHFWPGRRPSAANVPTARLRLVLVDYPGEWLADLPMVGMSYAEWSRSVLHRLAAAPWSDLATRFQKLLEDASWTGPDNNEAAERAAREWQTVLAAARDVGLKWLQPAQFLRREGQLEDVKVPPLDEQAFWFCPLPEQAIAKAGRGSLARAMAGRYDDYRTAVAKFFGETLKDASRHLLLVDVLDALAEGQHAFRETSEVLSEVYRLLAHTNSGLFRKLFSRAGFEKVLLLATKADAVPPSERAALKSLLSQMCSGSVGGAAGIRLPDAEYIAAIRATEDVEIEDEEGNLIRVVQGKCAETGKQRRVKLFSVPERMPRPEDFERRRGLRPPRFVPPKVEAGAFYGVPNARLGSVLNELVGDLVE